jgi:hypothetical protein
VSVRPSLPQGNDDVERLVGEGQRVAEVSPVQVGSAGKAGIGKLEQRAAAVDAGDAGAVLDQCCRKGAGAASGVEHAKARHRFGEPERVRPLVVGIPDVVFVVGSSEGVEVVVGRRRRGIGAVHGRRTVGRVGRR